MSTPAITVLHAAVRAITSDRRCPDLSARQLDILLEAFTLPPQDCTVRGLAARMNVPKAAVTRALDRLSELGLIVRRVDAADHRSVFAVITPSGRDFVQKLNGQMEKVA